MKSIVVAAIIAGTILAAIPARAEGESVSFAAAIAPEQAFEVCFKGDALSAAQCALDKCRKETGGSDECVITSACTNGWAGSMGVTTGEVHWTETVCGAPNEAAVIAALTAFCKGQAKHATECFLASVWDSHGKEKSIGKTLYPRKLK
ncbi:MAG: hypothetical protein JNM45_08090 [Rhizobiales bacterium]|nr:hypothetical protein [Hyphomicrobiales bacterium]